MSAMKRSGHKITALLRRLILVFLGLILGVSLYFANARGLTRNQLPMPFGTGIAVVLSGSMEPTLQIDDLIIVRQAEDYAVGDIVVYQTNRELIVHRIVTIDGDSYITQGDANNTPDDPIAADAIQGTVVRRIPAAGRIVNLLRSPVGTIAVLVLAFALIEGSFRKEKKADNEQLEAIKEEIRRLKAEQENQSHKEK